MKKESKCKLFHFFKVNIISGGSFAGRFIIAAECVLLLLIHLLLHAVLHFIKLSPDLFSGAKNWNKKACEKTVQYEPNEYISD